MRLDAFALTVLASLGAAAPPRVAHSPPAACTAPSFHRLDFWVGDWDVYDSHGKRYGSQHVRSELDGCALVAAWSGPDGDRGMALFAYDPIDHAWHQTYATNQMPAQSRVSVRRGDATYTGPGVRLLSPPGTRLARLTVTPLDGGRARQMLESSPDGGRTWTVVFNAEHRRHAAP